MLSGPEKTALLLLLLEEPEAANLLARLEPHEVESVGRAMLTVAEATPATIDGVLDEVLEIARETIAVGEGAPTVRDLLGRALGDDRAGGIIERLGEEARAPLFEGLLWLEPWAVASLFEGEHPQVQAFLLAQLPSDRAARILARLPATRQADVVRRIATLGPVMPQAAEALDSALQERIATARPRQPLADLGGMQRAADLINLAGLDEELALTALSAVDPGAAELLSETLFTFADLARLDARALQNLMRTLDADLLIPALRAAPTALREKLLAAMPGRAAEALKDEVDNRGPFKIEEADAAQKAIAAAARKLAADGTISLPGKGPAYV
jgi:flagellar motor switch protein FliG